MSAEDAARAEAVGYVLDGVREVERATAALALAVDDLDRLLLDVWRQHGVPQAELAAALGVTRQAVQQRIARAAGIEPG